jgi:hypothetical protein
MVGDFAAGVVEAELELVEPLVAALLELEPLELPQPASSAPAASSASAAGESLLIIGRPLGVDGCSPSVSAWRRDAAISDDEGTRGHGPRASAAAGA